MTINQFYTRFKYILNDKRGEISPSLIEDTTNIIIDGITYIVKVFYKQDTTVTMSDKIQRLIDKDVNCS